MANTGLQITFVRKDLAKRAEMFPKAGAAAMNRSQQKFRVLAVGQVTDRFNIRKGEVNGKLFVKRATPSNLVVTMKSTSRRLTVMRFDARETTIGSGVALQIVRGQTKVIRGGFINKVNGNKMVLKRTTKARYPLDVVRTISVTEMLASVDASKNTHKLFLQILEPELTRTIKAFHELGRE